jgi:hypothetical protein
MINDNFALTGALTIAVNDKVVQETHNLVVTSGKKWVARRMAGTDSNMTHMAIGTGTTAADAAQTTLVTELERNGLTVSGGTVTANAIAYACTYAAGDGTGAITEAGIFDTIGSKVDDITVSAGGSGYTGSTAVTFTGGGGSGATATATVVSGAITAVTVTGVGSSYTSAPTIGFTVGSGASATATLKEGGDMLARTKFDVVNKGASDSMTITWTITVS